MSDLVKVDKNRKVYMASEAVDFRLGVNGLVKMLTESMNKQAYDGSYFVFYNKAMTKLKVIFWDHNGFVMIYKVLDKIRFRFDKGVSSITPKQLNQLISGGSVSRAGDDND